MEESRDLRRSPRPAASIPAFSLTPSSKSVHQPSSQYLITMPVVLTAVDDGSCHEDTGPTSQCAHHVCYDRKQTKGSTTESRSSRDDPLELLVDRGVTVSRQSHVLVLELLGDVSWSRARYLDPSLGEDGAGSDDKGNVDDGVERV